VNINFYTLDKMANQIQNDRLQEAGNERLWRKALAAIASERKSADNGQPNAKSSTLAAA
jgi:hypothetical protein